MSGKGQRGTHHARFVVFSPWDRPMVRVPVVVAVVLPREVLLQRQLLCDGLDRTWVKSGPRCLENAEVEGVVGV